MKPLLRRSNLLPGESLLSLVERLTPLNYYSPRMINRLCRSGRNTVRTALGFGGYSKVFTLVLSPTPMTHVSVSPPLSSRTVGFPESGWWSAIPFLITLWPSSSIRSLSVRAAYTPDR